ncbi:MAG: chemotaxis protein CheB [Candidatus Riflebacteria bacterium]|nr:chemotaxis protein CheB [Candidatus Riflebacteria bacterium]
MHPGALAIGTSAGGTRALVEILGRLPEDFPLPIIVVQHLRTESGEILVDILKKGCKIRVKEAEDKDPIENGWAYFAPSDYHLLVESDYTLGLSADPPVGFARPSIDVMLESAARVYRDKLLALILTGASDDGTAGINIVKKMNGTTIAQDPSSAEFPRMPQSAIESGQIDKIFPLSIISEKLIEMANDRK